MTEPVPNPNPMTRWLWVGVIVVLAIAAVIFFLNADGDEELETVPDYAVTTQEERLNQPIREPDVEGIPMAGEEGANASATPTTDPVVITEDESEVADEPTAPAE